MLSLKDGRIIDGPKMEYDGDTLVVGAHEHYFNGIGTSGAAYVFTRQGTTWTELVKLGADPASIGGADYFGSAVALLGDTLAVGADREAMEAAVARLLGVLGVP